MIFTHEHDELVRTTNKIIDEHVNPYIDEWEKAEIYPAHQVMKKFAEAGLLGIGKPEEYGGLSLDFSYENGFCRSPRQYSRQWCFHFNWRSNHHVYASPCKTWQRHFETELSRPYHRR